MSPSTVSRKIKTALTQLRDNLEHSGLAIGAAALSALLLANAVEAAPILVRHELAKMAMAGSVRSRIGRIAPTPSPSEARPSRSSTGWQLDRYMLRAIAMHGVPMIFWLVIGALVVVTLALWLWHSSGGDGGGHTALGDQTGAARAVLMVESSRC